jgi:glycosyltransferase involved in cell wall biosynthesis
MFDIIIPTYKIKPHLIRRCLDSITKQDFTDYKVYLVDGTPPDWEHFEDFRSIVDSHDLVYLRQTGTGVSQARNQAVSEGLNNYLAFLDGDDYWYPEHLSELASAIDKTDESFVIWWNPMDTTIQVNTPKNTFESHKLCNYFADHNDWHPKYHNLYIATYCVFPSSVAVNKKRFQAIGGFPEDLFAGEDVICWTLMLGDSRTSEEFYLTYQNDFVGGFHDLQNEFGGDNGFFAKGQHPLHDLYGSDAAKIFDANLATRSKYFIFGDKPEDIDEETWKSIKSAKYEETIVVDN